MTYPAPFTSTTFVPGEKLTAVKLFTRVLTWLNSFLTAFLATGNGYQLSASGSSTNAFPTLSTYVAASGASVTITVPTGGRRYRVEAFSGLKCASSPPAHYFARVAYTAGASIGAQTALGASLAKTITQSTSSESVYVVGDGFVAAGTTTFFLAVERTSGGAATDAFIDTTYVAVYDVSAT